jgi:hypothetical protein
MIGADDGKKHHVWSSLIFVVFPQFAPARRSDILTQPIHSMDSKIVENLQLELLNAESLL